jgi:MoaA/NifB/PqqE/SkfB family radical SAM enzyme
MNWIVEKLLRFTGSQKFLSIQLDITNSCNLKCRHCYQGEHSSSADLNFEEWRRILDQYGNLANKLHLKPHFCLSGGEPTISPLFSEIIKELHSRWPGAGIVVLTNGTRVSEKSLSVMAEHKTDVQVSLDGPDALRHDFVRGAGGFDAAISGFKAMKNIGLPVTFQAVLSSRSAKWIEEYFEVARTMNAAAMNFTRFVPQGRGKDLCEANEEHPLYGTELRDAYTNIRAASMRTGIPTGTNLPLFALISPELGAHGKFGFQGLVVDYRGNLKVSSRADFRLGNVLESGMEELFLRHPLMEALRTGKIEGCGVCEFYDRCGGDRTAAFAAHGSFTKKDPGCWLS